MRKVTQFFRKRKMKKDFTHNKKFPCSQCIHCELILLLHTSSTRQCLVYGASLSSI